MVRGIKKPSAGKSGISLDDSKILAYAIPTDEELLIAHDTVRVIRGEPPIQREAA